MTEPGLFAEPDHVAPTEPEPRLSPDRRRSLRQRRDVDAGRHPHTRGPLHPDTEAAGPRCGNCRFRQSVGHGNRDYPKCTQPVVGSLSASAASDVRAWWPACRHHQHPEENEQ